MTDEQIKQRITQILQILHDPKIGFNGLFNDVKEEYLAELRKKIDNLVKEINPTYYTVITFDNDFTGR